MRTRRRSRALFGKLAKPGSLRRCRCQLTGWRGYAVVALVSLGAGMALESRTGGLLVLGYGSAGIRALRQRAAGQARHRRRDDALDELRAYVAAIRAGAPAGQAQVSDPLLRWQADAVRRLAARTGAPLADLLDRVVRQEREARQLAAVARAQAAGIRMTTVLLVGLPAVALLLGQGAGLRPFAVLLQTPWGAALAGAGGLLQAAGWLWSGRIAQPDRHRHEAELALAVDLIAGVLRAGLPVDAAVLAVGTAMPGSLGSRLIRVGRALRCGAPAAHAWRHLAGLPAAHRIGAAASLSVRSGSAFADALAQNATDLRAEAQVRQQEWAQRSAVLMVLPLGLCFLPAFMLVGLAPMILAVLSEVL